MRLIDADALIDDLPTADPDREISHNAMILDFCFIIMNQKEIDAEPVVRCGDCKYFQCNVPPDGYLPFGADEYDCRYWGKLCDPEDFCSHGERKDDNK